MEWINLTHSDEDQSRQNLKLHIVNAVRLLASEARQQVSFFPHFVSVGNELVRCLSDSLDQLREAGGAASLGTEEWTDLNQLVEIADVAACEPYHDPSELQWLQNSMAWEVARSKARNVLSKYKWEGPATGDGSVFIAVS